MTRLAPTAYLQHLRRESDRFRAAVIASLPGTRVPSCPDWDTDDLLWHLAEVQGFWGRVISERPGGPREESAARPEDRDTLLAVFDTSSAALHEALRSADPADEAWSWAPDRTVGFTIRRQAHEAMIHRLDAELAIGDVTRLPADLAVDGVAELVEVMYGGPPPAWGEFHPSGQHLRIDLTDTGDSLLVATGELTGADPESGREISGPHLLRVEERADQADAVVAGTAAAVDAWLWRRRDDTGITIEGDPDAYAGFRSAVDFPLD